MAWTEQQLQHMINDTSACIHRVGLAWKLSSVEVICSSNTKSDCIFTALEADGKALTLQPTEELLALGVLLDRKGSTQISLAYGEIKADHSYYRHKRLLEDSQGLLKKRLESSASVAVASQLYNCVGWHVTKEVLQQVPAIPWGGHINGPIGATLSPRLFATGLAMRDFELPLL